MIEKTMKGGRFMEYLVLAEMEMPIEVACSGNTTTTRPECPGVVGDPWHLPPRPMPCRIDNAWCRCLLTAA